MICPRDLFDSFLFSETQLSVMGKERVRVKQGGVKLTPLAPVQDFLLPLHGLKLLHLILCRVEEVTKADNYEASKKKDYYQLPIPRENIRFLQTWEETRQCWEKVLQVSVTWDWPGRGRELQLRVRLGHRADVATGMQCPPPQAKNSCFRLV